LSLPSPSLTPLLLLPSFSVSFFFNDTATTEIYTLSLHDALPISILGSIAGITLSYLGAVLISYLYPTFAVTLAPFAVVLALVFRSEEHTSELQSLTNLVCRLLLEKKNRLLTRINPSRATRIVGVT